MIKIIDWLLGKTNSKSSAKRIKAKKKKIIKRNKNVIKNYVGRKPRSKK
jgi:hypothetical protein